MKILSLAGNRTRPGAGSRLRLWLLMGLALTAACSGASGKSYPPYRYRLTVEIDTPQGLRSGSSVIEVHTSLAGANSIPSPGQLFQRVRGEAVAVDLPGGQTVFALLRSGGDIEWATHAYSWLIPRPSEQDVKAHSPDGKWTGAAEFDLTMERVLASRGPMLLPRKTDVMGKATNNWPLLVRFRDIRDPATVESVDPDGLSAMFGKGYAVRRIVVERTDDAVTMVNRARLPWADAYRDRMLDGAVINNSTALANNLALRDFISGE